MPIKRCKLGKRQQLRLLECFVLEVTARSAADMLGIQANTTMLFYRKVRHLIAGKLAEGFGYRDITAAVGTNNFCATALLDCSVEQIRVTIVVAYQEQFCAAKIKKLNVMLKSGPAN